MHVLVAYASKHGSTAAIAERIAESLAISGQGVTVRPVAEAGNPADHDAVVLGSAVYLGHWLKEARAFVNLHQETLARQPVWLFSSGPIGEARVDDQGHDLHEVAEPQDLPELIGSVHPQEHRVFFGALDPKRLTFAERALRRLPAGRSLLPEGDFREWEDVEHWATQIATYLHNATPSP